MKVFASVSATYAYSSKFPAALHAVTAAELRPVPSIVPAIVSLYPFVASDWSLYNHVNVWILILSAFQ